MINDEHAAIIEEAGHMHRYLQIVFREQLNASNAPDTLATFLYVRARGEPDFARQLLKAGGGKAVAEIVLG
jgi:hypothetical protein